jgi:hypothetical protein
MTAADRAIKEAFRRQGDLITRAQVLEACLTPSALRGRLGPNGRWKVVLPGVYLAHNGQLTAAQREIAAVLYAGRGCVITGLAAVRRQGGRIPLSELVDVLIPDSARRRSVDFVQVHRTTRMPSPKVIDGLRWAPPERAVADAARGLIEVRDVTALIAGVVQQGLCTIDQLSLELSSGPDQRSGLLRMALAEVSDGVASVAEADFRTLIQCSGLPAPLYNPRLFVGTEFLAMPDAWWAEVGVAAEVDSREWHLSPEAWKRTMVRHARMSAHGILVLHFPPSRIREDGRRVIAELRSAIDHGRERPRLAIRTVPTR